MDSAEKIAQQLVVRKCSQWVVVPIFRAVLQAPLCECDELSLESVMNLPETQYTDIHSAEDIKIATQVSTVATAVVEHVWCRGCLKCVVVSVYRPVLEPQMVEFAMGMEAAGGVVGGDGLYVLPIISRSDAMTVEFLCSVLLKPESGVPVQFLRLSCVWSFIKVVFRVIAKLKYWLYGVKFKLRGNFKCLYLPNLAS